jgi:hypothetical protein
MGLAQVQNGRLLQAAEEFGFDVLLTGDQSLKHEQKMAGRKIGVVAMSDKNWKIVKDYVTGVSDAVETVQPGQVLPVYCGRFIPRCSALFLLQGRSQLVVRHSLRWPMSRNGSFPDHPSLFGHAAYQRWTESPRLARAGSVGRERWQLCIVNLYRKPALRGLNG